MRFRAASAPLDAVHEESRYAARKREDVMARTA
jgi:hypothetical protein